MTFSELRDKIRKRYKVGQVVNMRERNIKGDIVRRFKAKIITYYPYTVSCDVDGHAESFTYYDFMVLTRKKEG